MEGLRELSKMHLKAAERTDAKEWENEATQDPVVSHNPKVTFSKEVTVIPTNPMANLDPTTVVGNNGSPARNTRVKFAVAAAALTAVVSSSQADAKQWEHRKHSPVDHKLGLKV